MTGKSFFNKVTNSEYDLLKEFIDILESKHIKFCVIGGLAVNVYSEPVVSLDMDIVILAAKIDTLLKTIGEHFPISKEAHSININSKKSDIRIQLQTDPRYQKFIPKAKVKTVLGYKISVARVEDVLQGKIWAYEDTARRPSKRQKDLADIMRLVENQPKLVNLLPDLLKKQILKYGTPRHT
ncbi:MAG: hypothetical protein PHX21_08725 [bacterium]|nr:hypothetical protein [bacterium]